MEPACCYKVPCVIANHTMVASSFLYFARPLALRERNRGKEVVLATTMQNVYMIAGFVVFVLFINAVAEVLNG